MSCLEQLPCVGTGVAAAGCDLEREQFEAILECLPLRAAGLDRD